jgi:biotin operon repressor
MKAEGDWVKIRVRLLLERGGWITAKELAELMCLEARDPLREIKKRIEELRDEGAPIVSLPKKPGPGYLWVGDPDAAGAQEAVRLYEADMKSRMGRMVKHLARIKRVTERKVQEELFKEVMSD